MHEQKDTECLTPANSEDSLEPISQIFRGLDDDEWLQFDWNEVFSRPLITSQATLPLEQPLSTLASLPADRDEAIAPDDKQPTGEGDQAKELHGWNEEREPENPPPQKRWNVKNRKKTTWKHKSPRNTPVQTWDSVLAQLYRIAWNPHTKAPDRVFHRSEAFHIPNFKKGGMVSTLIKGRMIVYKPGKERGFAVPVRLGGTVSRC